MRLKEALKRLARQEAKAFGFEPHRGRVMVIAEVYMDELDMHAESPDDFPELTLRGAAAEVCYGYEDDIQSEYDRRQREQN
jgi:hypothetical protein